MILIADDDSDFAENCSMVLEDFGYEVGVALSGSEALAKIAERKPELLISDCCMPDFGGLALIEKLRAGSSRADFPILLMSGSLRCEVAPGAGYGAFLRKPFLAEDLMSEVQRLLRGGARNDLVQKGYE